MATTRFWALAGAAVFAALALMQVPAHSQTPAKASGPLKLTPSAVAVQAARRPPPPAAKKAPPRAIGAVAALRPSPRKERGYLIQGDDTVGLVALLPWWRSDRMHAIRYVDRAAASQVLTAADAWIGKSFIDHAVDGVQIASADEFNELDLAADLAYDPAAAEPDDLNRAAFFSAPAPENPPWPHGWMVMLGGALAAAGTAKFLFV
ncbi:MAG: hypothetical protein QOI12_4533 [Alphaproteobacteria bacterium]|jgi:hypothetical protein|nr:hypothetical protein [Alphaproteobacteria bacterium]